MNAEDRKIFEALVRKRTPWWRKSLFTNTCKLVLVLSLILLVLRGFGCFSKASRAVREYRTMNAHEWEDEYFPLKAAADTLLSCQQSLKVYERFLGQYEKGQKSGYGVQDSLQWRVMIHYFKHRFNSVLANHKYNQRINNNPNFTDPEVMKEIGLEALPTGFMPYSVSFGDSLLTKGYVEPPSAKQH